MSAPKFTVAIIGGGIAGITAAISISRFCSQGDIRIDVYESAQAFTEIGAGLALFRRPWYAMKRLGLGEDLAKICRAAEVTDEPST